MIRILAANLLVLTLAFPAFCASTKATSSSSKLDAANYRVSFKMKNDILSAASSFLMGTEQQAKYLQTGEDPYESENVQNNAPSVVGVEFKKVTAIVNCVISRAKDGVVYADFQFELSGPVTAVGKRKAIPVRTFQYASPIAVRLGQTLVVVDGPDRHIEIRIDEVKP